MRRSLVLLVTLALLTSLTAVSLAGPGGAPSPGNAAANGPPACLPGNALENDEVRIWFQGLKGHIKVFDKSDENGTGVYSYKTKGIVEVAGNTTLATLDLGRAHPQGSTCSVEETDEWLNITFSVTEAVKRSEGGFTTAATATFAYHFDKNSSGAKFDLYVDDWPWQSEDSELAFDFSVHSTYTIESAENGIGFRDGSDSKGYIEWAMNATATYEDGRDETAIVDSDTTVDGGDADVRLRFTNVTAGYVHLDYDPWVGVGDYIILAGILIPFAPIEALIPAPARPVYDLLMDLI